MPAGGRTGGGDGGGDAGGGELARVLERNIARAADKRSELDLQISLLAEHELTRLIRVVNATARKLGVEESHEAELGEIERDVEPGEVERLERAESEERGGPGPPI